MKSQIRYNLAINTRALLAGYELSVRELCRRSGQSRRMVSMWLQFPTVMISGPTADSIDRLAPVFGLTGSELVQGREELTILATLAGEAVNPPFDFEEAARHAARMLDGYPRPAVSFAMIVAAQTGAMGAAKRAALIKALSFADDRVGSSESGA